MAERQLSQATNSFDADMDDLPSMAVITASARKSKGFSFGIHNSSSGSIAASDTQRSSSSALKRSREEKGDDGESTFDETMASQQSSVQFPTPSPLMAMATPHRTPAMAMGSQKGSTAAIMAPPAPVGSSSVAVVMAPEVAGEENGFASPMTVARPTTAANGGSVSAPRRRIEIEESGPSPYPRLDGGGRGGDADEVGSPRPAAVVRAASAELVTASAFAGVSHGDDEEPVVLRRSSSQRNYAAASPTTAGAGNSFASPRGVPFTTAAAMATPANAIIGRGAKPASTPPTAKAEAVVVAPIPATTAACDMLLGAVAETPNANCYGVDEVPTPQTSLTQPTQEAMLSQHLYGTSSGSALMPQGTQLSAGGYASQVVSQIADDVTPLAMQLARVQQPMTVGREAEATGEYAPPSPNVDLFADFGFTPLQSQQEMPQLRRRAAGGGNRSSTSNARQGAPRSVNGAAFIIPPPPMPLPTQLAEDAAGGPLHSPPATATAAVPSSVAAAGGDADAASPNNNAASQALELSPMTNTQRERREGDRWCMMAKNFFDFIDQKPLNTVTVVAPRVPPKKN